MNRQPILSFIVPVYNAATYLPSCIKAIAAQTRSDFEAIFTDDGSTDESPRILDEAARNDPRITVIRQPNGGVSTARNAGIAAARGKYLAFVDADDLIKATFAEQMLDAGETTGADLVLCGFERFRKDFQQFCSPTREPVQVLETLNELLTLYTEARTNLLGVAVWGKLYRADIVKEHVIRFDPTISYEEDCCFNTAYFRHVKRTALVGACLYRYRLQEESLSKGYRKDTFRFLVNGLHRRKTLLEASGMGDQLRKLDAIFVLVIKNTGFKIVRANLSRAEKLQEFGALMQFPVVQRIAESFKETKNRKHRRMLRAIRTKKPKNLYRVMRMQSAADRLAAQRNRIFKRNGQ